MCVSLQPARDTHVCRQQPNTPLSGRVQYNDVVKRTCTGSGADIVCTDSPDSWMTTQEFYAGLALAQAMPGPLFNFAAYLGASCAAA